MPDVVGPTQVMPAIGLDAGDRGVIAFLSITGNGWRSAEYDVMVALCNNTACDATSRASTVSSCFGSCGSANPTVTRGADGVDFVLTVSQNSVIAPAVSFYACVNGSCHTQASFSATWFDGCSLTVHSPPPPSPPPVSPAPAPRPPPSPSQSPPDDNNNTAVALGLGLGLGLGIPAFLCVAALVAWRVRRARPDSVPLLQ